MTNDEIIEMAREAGLSVTAPSWGYSEDYYFQGYEDKLKAFAKLVAEKEREACAKVCEEHPDGLNMMGGAFVTCANAIRARGQQ